MAIVNALVHRMTRGAPGESVKLDIGQELLPVNGKVEDLLRDLKNCYIGKAGKAYGQFSSEYAEYPFSRWLQEHLADKLGFASFNEKLLQHFALILADSPVSMSGHLLVVHESLADSDQLYLFFIEHNEGLYVDGEQQLVSSFYVDVSGVRLAVKVNLSQWQQSADLESEDKTAGNHYLSVLRARGDKDLTDAFYKMLGFTNQLDIAAETSSFLDVVAAYTRALPEDKAVETRYKVVEYCTEQDKSGRPVQFEQLSAHINEEEPESFSQFLQENLKSDSNSNPKNSSEEDDQASSALRRVKAELIPDRNQLRQFVRISGRSDALSMSFTSDCLGESIVYDPESDSITIHTIPASLKARLLKHMQGK